MAELDHEEHAQDDETFDILALSVEEPEELMRKGTAPARCGPQTGQHVVDALYEAAVGATVVLACFDAGKRSSSTGVRVAMILGALGVSGAVLWRSVLRWTGNQAAFVRRHKQDKKQDRYERVKKVRTRHTTCGVGPPRGMSETPVMHDAENTGDQERSSS
jgi:hypothetical protein